MDLAAPALSLLSVVVAAFLGYGFSELKARRERADDKRTSRLLIGAELLRIEQHYLYASKDIPASDGSYPMALYVKLATYSAGNLGADHYKHLDLTAPVISKLLEIQKLIVNTNIVLEMVDLVEETSHEILRRRYADIIRVARNARREMGLENAFD